MCGIYGIVSPNLSVGEIYRRLNKMGEIQHYRGPDDKKEIVVSNHINNVGLGFVRLAILDLETGMQPIVCNRDNSAIICNGQLYNYIELRELIKDEAFCSKGDIEVALHLYRLKGIDFLNLLNGMFAGAIFDPKNDALFLFRDRFGIKPLYYTVYKKTLIFSSEIKPILSNKDISREINLNQLPAFFTYRYIPGNETLFKAIYRLPPGSYLKYNLRTGRFKINRYWNYKLDRIKQDITIDEAADRFYHIFKDAVRIRLRSDVEVGCLISGGIDSSAVASQAAMFSPLVRLFSIFFQEKSYNELPSIERFLSSNPFVFHSATFNRGLCQKSQLNSLPGIINSLEEPISLGALIPTDQVCQLASQKVKVVLTGEGADEIFAGYRKFMIEAVASQFKRLPVKKQQELIVYYPELIYYLPNRKRDPLKRYIQNETLFEKDEIGKLTGVAPAMNTVPNDAMPVLSGHEDPVNASIAFECRFRLPDYVILRLDRMSMRHSLEARTPFLDYRLAEFAATLPIHLKTNVALNREKYICSHSFMKHGVLDFMTANRRKQPFTIPIAHWLSNPKTLPNFLQDILLGNVIHEHGLINPDFVRSLMTKITTQNIGPDTLVSEADRVFSIIIITLWYQEFFC